MVTLSVREPRLTQQQIEEYVKDEKDLRPWGGAGSVDLTAATIGKKNRQPTDARGRQHHQARAAFAEANQEATPLSPEEMQRVNEAVANNLKRADFKTYFANAVRNGIGLHQAWINGGLPGECPFFNGVERDGDPAGANENQIVAAWQAFARSPIFAAYYYAGKGTQSARYKVQAQINSVLWEFLVTNLVNPMLAGSWAACFALLENIGLVPAPVKSEAELRAEADAAPATDGNAVARKVDGTPVVYNLRGTLTRYSQQMLDALTADGYAMVMGLRKSQREIQQTEQERQQRKAHEYRTKTIGDTGYTQFELDSMPSEKYRQVMRLERSGGGSVGNRI